MNITPGSTSVSIDVYIQDTAGAPRTGLLFNAAGLVAWRRRGNGSPTSITLATLANAQAAWSSGGFVEISASNMPGWYRLDLPNDAIDVDADFCNIAITGASSMTTVPVRLLLRGIFNSLRESKAQAGSASSITLDSGASTTDDLFNNCSIAIIAGTGRGQSRYCSDYVGSTRVASVIPNWVTNPDTTSVFAVVPYGLDSVTLASLVSAIWDQPRTSHVLSNSTGAALATLDDGTAQAGAAGTITLASGASSVDAFYVGAIVQVINGTGVGQFRTIQSYVGSTRVATVRGNWVTAPNNTSRYIVRADPGFAELTSATIDSILDAAVPDSAAPPGSFTLRSALGWLASMALFRQTQTATTGTLRNRADSGNVATRTVADDGTTGTFGRWS